MGKDRLPQPGSPAPNVTPEQMDLPITLDSQGNFVTLRQFLMPANGPAPLPPETLNSDQWAELTMKRLEAQPLFEVVMLEAGHVDQKRAIQEVRTRTNVGKAMIEIQQLVVEDLLERLDHNY